MTVLSLRSRRQHKAWGVSPSKRGMFILGAREAGESLKTFGLSPDFTGSEASFCFLPGAHAPGFMLSLLRRLRAELQFEF
jgi:hypothetical protein